MFSSDGSAKSLLVDEKMTVGHVTRILAEKNHVQLDPKWALVELVPELYMERVYEDNENLVENCLMWKVDSKNTLWFIERPEKCDLFLRPEIYLLGKNGKYYLQFYLNPLVICVVTSQWSILSRFSLLYIILD